MPPPNAEPLKPRRTLVALGWGFACAICAAGVSAALLLDVAIVPNFELQRRLPVAIVTVAVAGAIGGVLAGLLVNLPRVNCGKDPLVLGVGGAVVGAIGGGLTIPTLMLCREWLGPVASVAVLWATVGFLAGVAAHRVSLLMPTSSPSRPRQESPPVVIDPVRATLILRECNRQLRRLLLARLLAFFTLVSGLFVLLALLTMRSID